MPALLAASHLVGTAMLRYIMGMPAPASLSAEDVVTLVAPSVRRYLTGDAAESGLDGVESAD